MAKVVWLTFAARATPPSDVNRANPKIVFLMIGRSPLLGYGVANDAELDGVVARSRRPGARRHGRADGEGRGVIARHAVGDAHAAARGDGDGRRRRRRFLSVTPTGVGQLGAVE